MAAAHLHKLQSGSSNHKIDTIFELFTPENIGLHTTFMFLSCLDPEKSSFLEFSIMAAAHLHKKCFLRKCSMMPEWHHPDS